MIAMALACDPMLLIADEPTTALDVTLQAQILDLMRELKGASGAAIILITHDLGVVAEVCDEVAVMYAGEIVERATVDELFDSPQHPYTVGLLGSIPRLDRRASHLAAIEGMVPEHDQAAVRLPLRGALPVRQRSLHCRAATIPGGKGPALVALHQGAVGEPGFVSALLEVEGLVKHFVAETIAVRTADRIRQGGRWRQLQRRCWQDAGAGRRIRLRQIDRKPSGAAADRTRCRPNPLSGA